MATEIIAGVEFRDIPGWPGYRVGSDGTVLSCRQTGKQRGFSGKWHELKQRVNDDGYLSVKLRCGDGASNGKHFLVHALVLMAFVGPRPAGLLGLHKNDVKLDNRVENLYWGTLANNVNDAVRNGRRYPVKGAKHHKTRLTESIVREIRQRVAAGHTTTALASLYRVSRSSVSMIATGKRWQHVT